MDQSEKCNLINRQRLFADSRVQCGGNNNCGFTTSVTEEGHLGTIPEGEEATKDVIKIGSEVPDFKLISSEGNGCKLSDFRGTKVMLCFYTFTHCPVCAYRVSNLIGEFKKLAWASRLKVITVFRTDQYHLKKGLASSGPIAELSGETRYPFIALADPNGSAASAFQVKSKGRLKRLVDNSCTIPKLIFHPVVMREGFLKGGISLLPSEFLIDENGVLVDVLRSKKEGEWMKMDRIKSFLLLGKAHPVRASTRRGFE